MSYILDVLSDERDRSERMIKSYKNKINNLPKGSIAKKNINGNEYSYLIFRENGKKKSVYIKDINLENIKKQLEKRKKLMDILKGLEFDLAIMEHAINYGERMKEKNVC